MSALVAVSTLIAGVYGMNFEHMPELGWMLGYPFALLLMVLSSVGLLGLLQEVRLAVGLGASRLTLSTPVPSSTSVASPRPIR